MLTPPLSFSPIEIGDSISLRPLQLEFNTLHLKCFFDKMLHNPGPSQASVRAQLSFGHNLLAWSQHGSCGRGDPWRLWRVVEGKQERWQEFPRPTKCLHGGEICKNAHRWQHLWPDQGDELSTLAIGGERGMQKLWKQSSSPSLGRLPGERASQEKEIVRW